MVNDDEDEGEEEDEGEDDSSSRVVTKRGLKGNCSCEKMRLEMRWVILVWFDGNLWISFLKMKSNWLKQKTKTREKMK